MKPSSYCILFIMTTLLSESFVGSRAMSTTKMEDSNSEQNVLSSFLSEEAADGLNPASVSRYMVLGVGKTTKGGNLKIIVVDSGISKGARALARGLKLYNLQDPEVAQPPENILTVERKGADQDLSSGIAIGRRDTMRCMVGRVYRPCWEV